MSNIVFLSKLIIIMTLQGQQPSFPQSHCQYQILHEYIHHFVFLDASEEGILEWYMHMDQLFHKTDEKTPLCLLFDFSKSKGIALSTGLEYARRLMRSHTRPRIVSSVVLLREDYLSSLLRTMARTLHIKNIHVLLNREREQAIEGLLNWRSAQVQSKKA
jgi:hypothetical protein